MVKFQTNIDDTGKVTLIAEYNNTINDLEEQAFKAFVAQAEAGTITLEEDILNNRTTVTFSITNPA